MKTYVDYGAWINGEHCPMKREQWLHAARIYLSVNIDELKQQITQARQEAARFPGYKPGQNYYNSNRVAAYYHVNGNRKWYYIQTYGPETAICIVACMYIAEILHLDPEIIAPDIAEGITHKHMKNPEKWGVRPGTKVFVGDELHIHDDLTSINYHHEAYIFSQLIEQHKDDRLAA